MKLWKLLPWAGWVPRDYLPDILRMTHEDWPWPFSKIPRKWNAWLSEAPYIKLLGTEAAEDHLDIPERGKWVLAWPGGSLGLVYLCLAGLAFWTVSWWSLLLLPWLSYFAVTTKGGWHFRFGTRKDYVDFYYTAPSASFKRFRD